MKDHQNNRAWRPLDRRDVDPVGEGNSFRGIYAPQRTDLCDDLRAGESTETTKELSEGSEN